MLQLVELALKVQSAGMVEIPQEVLQQMNIQVRDTIRLIYLAEGEDNLVNASKEFLLFGDQQDVAGQLQQNEALTVSEELLRDAGIPVDADLEVVCGKGRIIIFPADAVETEEVIPEELLTLFEELGISKEKIRVVLHTEEAGEDEETNLQTDR